MSDNKYEVTRVHIKTAVFDLLIMKLPESDLEDKLTYLTREKGLIKKSLYDDFIIAACVANINDFLIHLTNTSTDLPKLNVIRAEIIEKLIEINSSLDPNNLVINKNNVVKFLTPANKDLIRLVDNEVWNSDMYKETEQRFLKKTESNKPSLNLEGIKNIKDLDYTPVQKFWKRLGQYVTIKQFPENSVEIILGGRVFTARSSFEQYIVTVCVEELEDLFIQLDALDLPARVSSVKLIHELYELCSSSNPFLEFNNCQCGMNNNIDPFESKYKTASEGEEEKISDHAKKLFKHVEKRDLISLGNDIKEKVLGQDKAVDYLVDAIQRASVGLKDPNQPVGSFIFTGYSGCGKTYTAKTLAETLVGSKKGLITIDCSEYSSEHEYAKLIGSPSGYVGHEAGGYLTNAVRKQPFSVVLFDEIEKANEKVHQLLLQIMDEARLTDGKGNIISFKDTIIIMTSNIGVKEVGKISKTIGFGDVAVVTDEKREKVIGDALKGKFKPEFLNRVTSIINFSSLNREHYNGIIKLEMNKLNNNLKLSGTDFSQVLLEFDDSLIDYIYDIGVDEQYGARPLKRAIERELATPLARRLLSEDITGVAKALLSIKEKKLFIEIEKSETLISEAPFYMNVGIGQDSE